MGLSARLPAAADTAGFVPEIWSLKAQDAIENNLVLWPLIDHSYEKELKKGDTVNVPVFNNVTAQEVVVGSVSSLQDPATGNKIPIVVNQWWDCPIPVDEMTSLQNQIPLLEKGIQRAGYAIAKKIDSTIAALFKNLNSDTIKGSDGVALDDDVLIDMMETLDEADCPRDNRFLVVDPSCIADLMKIDKFVRADYVAGGAVAKGQIGQIYGCKIFVTNNLEAVSGGTGSYGCMFHKEALAGIMQQKPKIDHFPEPLKHQNTVNVTALWGLKEMRDTWGVPFYTRRA